MSNLTLQDESRPALVRAMFARIARAYDLNNRVHSLWRDQAWRRRAVRAAGLRGREAVLDAACGTGDLTALFRRAGTGRVVGLDFCPEMLELARKKLPREPIEWVCGDAQELPFGDGEFDVVSIAFGIRNVADPNRALTEFFRVLRPGGRVVVLEFDRPRGALGGALVRFYLDRVMPRTAAAIARDRHGAYDYLRESVQAFLSAEELAVTVRRTGFTDVSTRRLTLGIATLHRGFRP
jgi:demethylmenaquinone methyltransferase/2-methoxy-6-polyprenyl-1,4-benzoquinol methylase